MAASSATQPSGPDYTYTALVNDIIAHPLFPLIIKKVFDVCQCNAFEKSHLKPHFSETESNARGVQNYAQQHGLADAWARWASTDVFMSALVASLSHVSSTGPGDNVTLRRTITAGQTALSAVLIDPQQVDPMHVTRDLEVQRNDHGLREDTAPRPSASREMVYSAQQFHESPSSAVQTPRAATRSALSEKAKETLEKWFQEHISAPYPKKQEKDELAALCDISLSSVNNWFGNKRMRVKRKMLRVQSQQEESITDKVLAPKSKWNAVVLTKLGSQAGRDALESATGASVLVPPALDGGRDEHSVLRRAGAGPSIPLPRASVPEKAEESSDAIHPRRPRRRQGRAGLSALESHRTFSVSDAPPTRKNTDLPKEGHHFPPKLNVGPFLPRAKTIAGQGREGVEISEERQAMQSEIQLGTSALPGTAALTEHSRDGSNVHMKGHSLPPISSVGPSVLPRISMATEQVRNSGTVYRASQPLTPHSLAGIPMIQTTVLTEKSRNNAACAGTHAAQQRQWEDPLNLQTVAKLPESSSRNVKPKKTPNQQAQEPIGHTTQFFTARGLPDAGSTVQGNRADDSQTAGRTGQTQSEDQSEPAGSSRFTRRSKRRKQAKH